MARDFRPKSARAGQSKGGVGGVTISTDKESKKAKPQKEKTHSQSNSSDEDDDEGLLKVIRAMGGDESDLALVRKGKGKADGLNDKREEEEEEEVSKS
jgi:hypothetical protein